MVTEEGQRDRPTKSRIEMVVPYSSPCFHCCEFGHWTKDCPLLTEPEDKAEHDARFDRVMERWNSGEITTHDKQRIIAKENDLWKARQARMRKAAKVK